MIVLNVMIMCGQFVNTCEHRPTTVLQHLSIECDSGAIFFWGSPG